MLRRTMTQRAGGAIDLPPTPLGNALLQRRVLRLLGGPLAASGGETAARLAKVYTDIADSKTKSAALPDGKSLAMAGRAAALLSCNCLDDAAADVASISSSASAGSSNGLARIAASLQVRVATAKLAHLVRTANVQGSESWIDPSGISTAQTNLCKDIARLSSVTDSKKDFVPVLLAAEAALNGAGAGAVAAFDALSDKMFTQSAQGNFDTSSSTYAAMAFDAQRAWAAEQALSSSSGKSGFKNISAGTGSVDKAKALNAEENAALLQVAAWAEDPYAPMNVLDMGDAGVAGYGPAQNSAQLLLKVGHFLGLHSAHNAVLPNFDQVLASGFNKAGTHDVSQIESALKNGKEDVLQQLGAFQCARLSQADDAYSVVNEALANGYGGHVTDFSNLSTPHAQASLLVLEEQLLSQAHARAKVGMAAACASDNQLGKADQLLDDVISEASYAELWRAYLLKGNVAKKLGKVEASDAAFRALHDLKMQPEGLDLPLRDKNRDISAF